jgi:hypothetical protein
MILSLFPTFFVCVRRSFKRRNAFYVAEFPATTLNGKNVSNLGIWEARREIKSTSFLTTAEKIDSFLEKSNSFLCFFPLNYLANVFMKSYLLWRQPECCLHKITFSTKINPTQHLSNISSLFSIEKLFY